MHLGVCGGQIHGKAKIEIAQDALKSVVKDWNPAVELGLTVYGHRTKGDCNDIESVIPIGKIDKNRVIRTVMGIKPKGKTPMSRSLRKVAQELKYTEEKATIILISDRKETCDPDPCGTAKALQKEGIDFITHVIGFNVDKNTDKQLECIANVTGGEYFSAKNAAALNKAMKVIVKKVEVAKPKPKPKVKKLDHNIEVSASEKEGGKWIKAYHRIYKVIDGVKEDSQTTGCSSYKKRACLEQIAIGKYLVVSEYNGFKQEQKIEIKAGETTQLNAIFGQFLLGAKCSDMKEQVAYEVYASSGQLIYEKKSACSDIQKITLESGSYSVEAKINSGKREMKFTVGSEHPNKLIVDLTNLNHEEEIAADQ